MDRRDDFLAWAHELMKHSFALQEFALRCLEARDSQCQVDSDDLEHLFEGSLDVLAKSPVAMEKDQKWVGSMLAGMAKDRRGRASQEDRMVLLVEVELLVYDEYV